ncbi:MAG TPA: divergent polysaccharide deacetylase family protein [Thermoanaerobaculia bacterium]|nr:divergent polysaccharide deacetylase family protein [Thermoanaerobaculia bacterium]
MKDSFRTVAYLLAIPLAGLAVFFLWNWVNGGAPKPVATKTKTVAAAKSQPEEQHADALPRVQRRQHRGDIVLIIDDVGFDGQPLDRLTSIDPNLNFSVLPNGNRTASSAELLHARGFELLCHLPMEPRGDESPGRNAILTAMSDDEIVRTTRENLNAVPFARGMNNHMGSRATADRRVMTSVLHTLPKNMYFIDSRTTGDSIAGRVAREMSIPTATRNVFLDDIASERAVRHQLAELASAAETRGVAIGIGHPYAVTVKVLTEEVPRLRAQGFRFVRASDAVH